MKKLIIGLLSALFILTGCSSTATPEEEPKKAPKNGTLTVGMECNYAPFNWTQVNSSDEAVMLEDGSYADGYDVQVAKRIAEELDMELVIKKMSWDGLEPALQANVIDLVIAGMTDTEERRQRVDFTSPYYESDMVMIVKKDGDLANASTLKDFEGKTILGQMNTLYDTIIDQIPNVNHAKALEDYPAMVMQLDNGLVDGLTAELPVAAGIIATNPNLSYVEFEPGKGFNIDLTDTSVSIAVNKENTELKAKVQSVLDDFSDDEKKEMMDDAIDRIPASIEELSDNLLTSSYQIFSTYFPLFLSGIQSTLILAFSGTILGLIIGLLIGGLRAIKIEQRDSSLARFWKRCIWLITTFYIEIFRGTPMMVQSAFIYYGLKGLLDWSPMVAGIFVITINTGAYMAEIMRAGIQSVDDGQMEAARSLGMNSFQAMTSIVLPQAIRNSFPSIGNEFVTNIKDSSVLNIIAVTELFYQAKSVAGSLYAFVPTYFVVALVYLCLTFPTTRILDYIEKRMNRTATTDEGGN
ncbi:MAG: ABC transporter permease subunit [Coprobacillaceae bacterium]